ncbi:MAG: type VI secretion system tip protein VgrG [Desulfobulbus sp.]|nr:type VI secretion system tip protein VgrG [Desulfobulbus sp.]
MKFWRIVGHETFSRPSFYELTVLSGNRQIKANDVLGRAFDVVIDFFGDDGNKHERHCQGHAVRFTRLGQAGRYFEYRIVLRSWFWLLTKRVNSRILQDKPVLDIAKAVFDDSPIKAIQKIKPDGMINPYDPRPYCVQHQESDYHYLSRLFEDECIYYWFDAHDIPDAMRLADESPVAHTSLPVSKTLEYAAENASEARHDCIVRWISAQQLDSGRYASRDVFYEHVKTLLSSESDVTKSHELDDLEIFEYPGGYRESYRADNSAPLRMDELESSYKRHWALTHWPDVGVGRTFTFQGDPDGTRDGDYLIAACTFVVSHPGYEGMPNQQTPQPSLTATLHEALADDAVNARRLDAFLELIDDTPELRTDGRGSSAFLITVLPAAFPFRPPRLTPRVTMPGPQNAIVTGPAGEELHVDNMGRVKVQFHWDRYGKKDENSTCWIRVSQPWAGKNWGGYFMPRIGQEVLVDFVNGDPDRPVIVGRLYNDDQPIPFDTPTQSGFRTRSTPGGSAANCNEFRFEDKKGSEQVFLHAERNQDIEVEANETHWVGHDRKKTIDHDEDTYIKNDRTEMVGHDEIITIGNDRTEVVNNDEDITIGANRTEEVGGDETIAIAGNRTEDVGANEKVTIGANRELNVGANETVKVGAARTETIGAGLTQTVTGPITVSSTGPTTFTATGGFNVIAPGGTKIIDMELGEYGGTKKWLYGLRFEIVGTAIGATGISNSATGMSNQVTGISFSKTGAENKVAATLIKKTAVETVQWLAFISGASSEIHL